MNKVSHAHPHCHHHHYHILQCLIDTANQHSARRQEFFGGETESMEQSSRYTATTQHRIRAVQTTSKDISFWRDCSALVTFCL